MIKQDKKIEINYLNKDFQSFRNNLMEFAKAYFPNSYNDFNETSPGMMFIEMASYVGDVLSYYIDSSLKESLLPYAEERGNVLNLAQTLGYKPLTSTPSITSVDVYQVVPNDNRNVNKPKPDLRYGSIIKQGMEIVSSQNATNSFRTVDDVNFRFSSSLDPMQTSVYSVEAGDSTKPSKWLLKKSVQVKSGALKIKKFTIGVGEKYFKLTLPESNILSIESVVDSNGNKWYEVPYLAQDTLFEDMPNVAANDPTMAQYNDTVPYILKLIKTSRRFATKVNSKNQIEMQFGAGISDNADEEIIPNPTNVGGSLPNTKNSLDLAFDPSNFLYTKAYGQIPSNTTLTIKYTVGGGVSSNVGQDTLTKINRIDYNDDNDSGLDVSLISDAKASIAVTNKAAATGGKGPETLQEIKNNALAYFAAQQRAVTKEDYITRIYSLPAKYGSISKVYIVQDDQLEETNHIVKTSVSKKNETTNTGENLPIPKARIPNPLALNFYTLGFDNNKRLTNVNEAVKNNLKIYLGEYRMLTDAINIKDAYIINIGVEFSIKTLKTYNKREVLVRCIDRIKKFFEIDKWQIGQPIIKSDLIYELSLAEGVRSVDEVEIVNKYDSSEGYSGNVYSIEEATKEDIIYPSADPSIFELKYFNTDIKGRAQ